ncbi:hypothetical protein KIW84_074668 [Lathyrus oleraceus]|uniref:Ketoreductase domain-containing protein n=1 Tax=Pisum sativum TaxID=3888 RepID=A0A9D4VS32_PEA|nr:hypothetical protein KIW84_074668 [Pisum sativum]
MATQISHLEPWCSFAGKVVLITGASAGIGRDLCLDLAKAGCRVVLAARRVDRLQSVCDEINGQFLSQQSRNLRAVAVELDVSADGSAIEKYVEKAWEAFGHIDALINNAGIRGNVSSPLELSEEEWNKVFKTNITGTWLVSKYVCKLMCDSKRKGSIINISSIAGLERGQLPGATAYACSKAGVNMLTKVISL